MRLLFYGSVASEGHVYTIVNTLRELQTRGFDVITYTQRRFVDDLRSLGFDARKVASALEEMALDDWKARLRLGAQIRIVDNFVARFPAEASDIQRILRDEQIDVLLIDGASMGAAAAAQASGIPWAQYASITMPIPSEEAPPWGLGLRPRLGRVGRLRDRILRTVINPYYGRTLPQFNRLREGVGARSVKSFYDLFATADTTICFTAEPFEYAHTDWPSSINLVGPGQPWEPNAAAPSWLEEITEPIVLVSASSEFQNDGRLVQTTFDAMRGDDVFVVATSASIDPHTFSIPDNARIERHAPHRLILEKADCAVTSAGMGLTQKALSAGVPVCAVPFGRDQPEVAMRVVVADAGTALPSSRLNRKRLRRSIREAMTKTEGARRIASAFSSYDSPKLASDLIEQLLRPTQENKQVERQLL